MKKLAFFLLFAVCAFATDCDLIPTQVQKLEFCHSQSPRFDPIEAASYPADRSDAEGSKDWDADTGKNQFLGLCGYLTPVAIPEPTSEAISFYKSGNILWIVQLLWSLAIPALIVFSGFSVKLRNFSQSIIKQWMGKTALFTLFFLLIVTVLTLPLDFYASYVRPHSYGLSNQTLGRWLHHYLTGTAVSTVVGILIVWFLYGIIRVSPKRWWLYFGLLNFPLAIFIVLVQPIWVAPLFNKFGPMQDKQLEQKILGLASRAGIEGSRVYEVNMSADTKQINAYVTGVGTSKRIVIWDTAIAGLSEEQLLFVMGHEMGHYVLDHLWWGLPPILCSPLLSFSSFTSLAIGWFGGWADGAISPPFLSLFFSIPSTLSSFRRSLTSPPKRSSMTPTPLASS